MKVLLLNPPTPYNDIRIREGRCIDIDKWSAPFTPISLAYLAAQVDKIAESKLIDSGPEGKSLDDIFTMIDEFKPELVIFTSSTPTANLDFEWFLPRIKKRFPAIKLATTGIHATVLVDKIMEKYHQLDFIILGEPEITTYELTRAIKENLSFENILGLAFRDKEGNPVKNSPRPFVENLDDLGMPAWHKVDFHKYIMPIKNRPFSLINITRGCPYSCRFCISHVYAGQKFRTRSPGLIVEEIKLLNSLGVYEFLFWTEFLTVDHQYLDKLLSLIIEQGLDKQISWVTNSRADHADLEIFKKMKKAGCWQIVFGLEFGTDEMLQRVNKGGQSSVAMNKKAVSMAYQAGFTIDGHFIIGYPGETQEQVEKTIQLALSLPLTFAHFYAASPFPGSKLYDNAVEQNLFDPKDWDKVTLGTISLKNSNVDVEEIMRTAYRKFYLRPQIWWRIFRIARSPREYKSLIGLSVKFLKGVIFKK